MDKKILFGMLEEKYVIFTSRKLQQAQLIWDGPLTAKHTEGITILHLIRHRENPTSLLWS